MQPEEGADEVAGELEGTRASINNYKYVYYEKATHDSNNTTAVARILLASKPKRTTHKHGSVVCVCMSQEIPT